MLLILSYILAVRYSQDNQILVGHSTAMQKSKYQHESSTPTVHRPSDNAERHMPPQYELEDPLGSTISSGATGVTSRFQRFSVVVADC
jgi:hypothetical protein